MHLILIARQSDPEIKNIAQKNHIAGDVLQRGQQLKEGFDIPLAAADVRIRNHYKGFLMIFRGNYGARLFTIHPIQPNYRSIRYRLKKNAI